VPRRESEIGEPQENVLVKLRDTCEGENTILLGDFNLHHPAWGATRVQKAENLAEELIDLAETKGMTLATPIGAVIWTKEGNEGTTIDLTFVSNGLYERLIFCQPSEQKDTFRDHTSVETVIMGDAIRQDEWRWTWKDADQERMTRECEGIDVPTGFTSTKQLEEYAAYLQDSVVRIVHANGKKVRGQPQGKSWWNPRVQSAVDGYKTALREHWHPDRTLEARRTRNKVVREEQAKSFRNATYQAAGDPRGLWRLTRWAKDRSGKPPELPRVPPLTRGDGSTAHTFTEKTQTL
jgi:hypothetical protein